jgi:hypothetical protein
MTLGQFIHFWLGPEQNWQLPNLKTSCLSNFRRLLPAGGASVLLRKKAQRNSVAYRNVKRRWVQALAFLKVEHSFLVAGLEETAAAMATLLAERGSGRGRGRTGCGGG